ncbi:MAG: hypothetical protein AAF081_06365 [Actinomycetota bacterium]
MNGLRRRLSLGALVVILTAGCSDAADDQATPDPSTTRAPVTSSPTTTTLSTTTTSSTTTAAPPEPEPVEGFDIDREFDSDSEAESFGPIGATETTLPTSEGEISVGGGEVPELGGDFPLPDGFEVQLTTEIDGEIGFSGRVTGELAELVAFYEAELATLGYTIVERQDVPDTFAVLSLEGPLVGDVVIAQEPGVEGGWTIAVGLAEPG